MNNKTVLITGASAGIGRNAAIYLVQQGYQVWGTSRHPQEDFDSVKMVQLDVTSDDSVNTCIDEVIAQAGKIDVLINNAGIAYISAFEETTIDEIMAIYDTNYFGVLRMTRAVLPHMRERGQGHIIAISSFGARVPLPALGDYSATKAALSSIYTTLSYEVGPLGIKVSVVEPGTFKSEMGARVNFPENPIALYDYIRNKCYEAATKMQARAPEPDKVSKLLHKIIEADNPRIRYLVGQDTRVISMIKTLLPEPLFTKFVRSFTGTNT